MATLTPEQRQASEAAGIEPVRVEDPGSGTSYDIIRADVYEAMREMIAIEQVEPSLYDSEDFRPAEEAR